MSVFGPKIAIAYVIVGLILAVVGGTLIESSIWKNTLSSLLN